MKSIKLLFYILVLPFAAFTTAHEFYVSVTQVDYIKEEQAIQITTRIFIDDFEDLLRQRYDETITLNTNEDESSIDAYIEKYMMSKIQIGINGEFRNFKFIGKEYEDDIVYCFLEISDVDSITTFEITNQLLFDIYNEQQNIVKLNINSKKKSFMLTPHNASGVLNFN